MKLVSISQSGTTRHDLKNRSVITRNVNMKHNACIQNTALGILDTSDSKYSILIAIITKNSKEKSKVEQKEQKFVKLKQGYNKQRRGKIISIYKE